MDLKRRYRNTRLLQESYLTARQKCRAPHHVIQATTSEGLAQGPYVVARVRFKSATLLMKGTELTTEPPRPGDFHIKTSKNLTSQMK